jgi:hypothetical protein
MRPDQTSFDAAASMDRELVAVTAGPDRTSPHHARSDPAAADRVLSMTAGWWSFHAMHPHARHPTVGICDHGAVQVELTGQGEIRKKPSRLVVALPERLPAVADAWPLRTT